MTVQGELIEKNAPRKRPAARTSAKPKHPIPTQQVNAFSAATALNYDVPLLMIDPGTNTGFALRDKEGVIRFGGKSFAVRSQGDDGRRWFEFENQIIKLIDTFGIRAVGFEDVKSHGQSGVRAGHVYGAWRCMVEKVCFQKGIRIVYLGVQQIKISWCGSGGASKEMMIAQSKRMAYNVPDDNDNVSDALGGLHAMVANEIGWTHPGTEK